MKKITTISTSIVSLLLPFAVFAAQFAGGTIQQLVENIQLWLLWLLGAAVVIGLVIAGIFFVTAQGDTEKVKTARQFVIWSLVGGAVGLGAMILLNLITTMTGGSFTE